MIAFKVMVTMLLVLLVCLMINDECYDNISRYEMAVTIGIQAVLLMAAVCIWC